jgi:hypothetical protein
MAANTNPSYERAFCSLNFFMYLSLTLGGKGQSLVLQPLYPKLVKGYNGSEHLAVEPLVLCGVLV